MQNSDKTQSTRPQKEGNPPKKEDPVDQTKQMKIKEISREETESADAPPKKEPRRRLGRVILLGLLGVLILAALGGLGGYFQAVNERVAHQEAVVGTEVADQFLLGLINYERGEYEIARQRFEHILKIDPDNAPAAEELKKVLLEMAYNNQLPTARPTATIGITATPDTRQLEEIYNQVILLRDQQNWDTMLMELDSLRSHDIDYKTVEVDGLYYLAYRNRGLHRIQVEGNLEGGIFDINRAELYGPLDVEARNYRDWSSSYITGVSFWEINWDEVLNYLSPLAISAPFLSDSSHFTVQDRVATAQVEVYSQLVETARYRYDVRKWCDAYDLFNEAATYIQLSNEELSMFQDAKNKCFGIEPTQPPTEEPVGEPTATPEP